MHSYIGKQLFTSGNLSLDLFLTYLTSGKLYAKALVANTWSEGWNFKRTG